MECTAFVSVQAHLKQSHFSSWDKGASDNLWEII